MNKKLSVGIKGTEEAFSPTLLKQQMLFLERKAE